MSNLSKLLTRGGALARQGDLVSARAEFEKAVRDHGRNAEPWISLSAVHGMEGNFPEALRCARKAVELAPNSLQGWVNLANAARSCGDLAQAADAFRRASVLPGCPSEVTLDLGLALVHLEKWAEAVQLLRDYCSRHPGHRD
ncbi:MAG TPA: tetratricopeptide repeat protein, partial [Burkholderiales bacterium]|nr:tetratricopeptide repeat protein [Burkholderiales bacterium]